MPHLLLSRSVAYRFAYRSVGFSGDLGMQGKGVADLEGDLKLFTDNRL
jgi:hypothetical protein